ncbi:MAG: hypothetical protein UY64_C0017G0009 [Parcubacteria group bacterium GW2011_GWA1_51_12]|nr:MAG: hypothetical protein UY64_C0017G0009 [Parcubacteria group bacterium GW2011_GWA1_51_12]
MANSYDKASDRSLGSTGVPARSKPISDIIPPKGGQRRGIQPPPILKKPAVGPKPAVLPAPETAAADISSGERREIEKIDRSVAEFFSKKPVAPSAPARERQSDEPGFAIHSWKPSSSNAYKRVWIWGGGIAGGLIGAAFLLSTVFARVVINIRPLAETSTLPPLAIRVLADAPALDPTRGVIPGEMIEFSEIKTFENAASGRQYVSQRARGTIVISNSYSSQPQVLVVNTRFAAKDGKIFRLEKAMTVPGAKVENGTITPSTIVAGVIAAEPGAAYNIGPSDFVVPGFQGTPKFKGFTAKSAEAFSGGFEGDAAVATESDIKKAVEQATAETFSALRESLKTKIPQGFRVIEGAREVAILSVEAPQPKTPGDKFSVKVSGKVSALVFRESDEGDLVAVIFSTTTPRVFIPAKSSFERKSVSLDVSKRQLSYVLGGSAALGARLDAELIQKNITGKTPEEITKILQKIAGIEAYKMKLFPVWLWRAPRDTGKVRVNIEPFPSS